MKWKFFLCWICTAVYSYAQSPEGTVKFHPEPPIADGELTIVYNPRHAVASQDTLFCYAYFTGISDSLSNQNYLFPFVKICKMERSGDSLVGRFIISKNSLAVFVVFRNRRGVLDNNNGLGYWRPILRNGEITPGTFSSIAEIYAGDMDTETTFGIKRQEIEARKLFEKEFAANNKLKRLHWSSYLTLVSYVKEKEFLKAQLDTVASWKDLNEWELKRISSFYGLLNEKDNADKFSNLIFSRYPNGSWALQTASLKPAYSIDQQKNFKSKTAAYADYLKRFPTTYPDEFTNRVMTGRRGQILAELVDDFLAANQIGEWMKETQQFDDEFKVYAYTKAVHRLMKRRDQVAVIGKELKTSTISSPFAVSQMPNHSEAILLAEALAREAVDLWAERLNSPRTIIDPLCFTDDQIHEFRIKKLSTYERNLGDVFLEEGKYDAAVKVLFLAFDHSHGQDSEINELYVEALAKTMQLAEAASVAQRVIAANKSTAAIDQFLSDYAGSSEVTDMKRLSLDSLSIKVQQKMIDESIGDIHFVDRHGKASRLSDFRGKVVVVDFWASWCPPCIAGLDALDDVHSYYKNRNDVEIIYLNVGDREKEKFPERVERFFAGNRDSYNVFSDSDNSVAGASEIRALPMKLVIDKSGKLRYREVGYNGGRQEQAMLVEAVVDLLID